MQYFVLPNISIKTCNKCKKNITFIIVQLLHCSLFWLIIMICCRIFVNRSLHLENIKFYGFDMDYTLAGKFIVLYKTSNRSIAARSKSLRSIYCQSVYLGIYYICLGGLLSWDDFLFWRYRPFSWWIVMS